MTDTDVVLHEGEEGVRAAGLHVEAGESGEVHPEELVILPDPGQHDLQLHQVGTRLAHRVQLQRFVHPTDLQHLEIGARIGLEESPEIFTVVLVVKVKIQLGDGVVGRTQLTDR